MLRCIGCGASIQTKYPDKPGFVKEEVLENKDLKDVLCSRCFRIKNYNEYEFNPINEKAYFEIINKIIMSKSLFIYVADCIDLTSINFEILSKLQNRDLIIVMNRVDLLPKSIKEGKIKASLKQYLFKNNIKYKDIILTSAKTKHNIDNLISSIERNRKGNNVYMLGMSNVGKSTLLNALIKAIGLLDNDVITVSNHLATTLNLIEIPFFADGKKLFDTPGLVLKDNYLYYLAKEDFKFVEVKKEIKARLYQLKKGDSLIVGGLFALDVLDDMNLVLYFSNNLEILKTKSLKSLEMFPSRSLELFKLKAEINNIKELEYDVIDGNDLLISGLGFISFKSKGEILLKIKEEVKVELKDGLFA